MHHTTIQAASLLLLFFYTNMYFMLSFLTHLGRIYQNQFLSHALDSMSDVQYEQNVLHEWIYITCTVYVPTFTKAEWRYMLCGIITAPTIPTACKTIKHTWKTNCNGDGTRHWLFFHSFYTEMSDDVIVYVESSVSWN